MGERYDVLVTAEDGVFPLTAVAEGKKAAALAVLRTGGGAAPAAAVRPAELQGRLLTADKLRAARSVALPAPRARPHDQDPADRRHGRVRLGLRREALLPGPAPPRPRG